ncbi:DNA polymerase III subunit chi [Salinisphaera japonica]|uniref:DNA polymerase III subunit chi n=1 Tax=Salinisphaera japonica YTM-1 TaxID=1209778 RepID=A0A423PU25_9GAMM|nr:DNA polymerase III subunit chi [Salinisphaera japonica]ROO29120.1 DNA polymerase III subunit chi [Salinisphaera japonica YTM-1]
MTEVFFYILEDTAADAPDRFAARLIEKAHGEGHRVYVHVADADAVAALDKLLWTFRQGSFVPHVAAADLDADDDLTPIVIGAGEPPDGFNDVLVNVGGDVGAFFSRFARHNEIAGAARVAQARTQYRYFKDRGYALTTHKIPAR